MSELTIFIQLIGFVGVLFGVISFQPKKRKNILRFQLLSNLFWVIHFFLLGAVTGAALNGAGALRAYLFDKYNKRTSQSQWLLIGVISLMVALVLLTWQGWISLLPMIGMIVATIGFWQRDEQRIRLFLLFASPWWLSYNALSGSYAGVVSEVLATTSILVALWRYRRQRASALAVPESL
jgi:hypothetical protein